MIKIAKEYAKPRKFCGIRIVARGRNKTKAYNYNRKVVVDTKGRIHFVHHLVWKKHANKKDISRYESGGYHIHHINNDFLDNSPENLKLLKAKKHRRLHAGIKITEYNKSEEHRERVKALHRDGHYSRCTWAYTYNGSDKHREDCRRMWKDPDRVEAQEAIRDTFRKYNQSEHHRTVVSKRNKRMWRNPDYRQKMIERLQNRPEEELNRMRKGIRQSWKKEGEGDRRVLARMLSTMKTAVNNTGTGASTKVILKEYDKVRSRNTPSVETMRKKETRGKVKTAWNPKRLVLATKKGYGIRKAVRFVKENVHENP